MSNSKVPQPSLADDAWRERGVVVVKLNPAGREVARYPAEMLDEALPETWLAVQATWTMKRVEVAGLVFEPGDILFEYFSTERWFNAFRIVTPDGTARGIYGNVTYPTSISTGDDGLTITWHDLYLDVLRLPDGLVVLCDEDELADSGLEAADPALHARIRAAAGEMLELARAGTFPFDIPRTD
jgi:predicted RNA-binding protein associated with RNAse of E/G family